jgi:hypothetical protein
MVVTGGKAEEKTRIHSCYHGGNNRMIFSQQDRWVAPTQAERVRHDHRAAQLPFSF